MNLHEYQAKQLFAENGLPVPEGYACTTRQEVIEAANRIGGDKWVAKCQVHAGGRGNAGGVKLHTSREELVHFAQNWFGKRLVTNQTDAHGQLVSTILIEAVSNIVKEFYLSAVVDRASQRIVFMASTEGGVDIETIAATTPELIHKTTIDPLVGPQPYQGRELAFKLGLEGGQIQEFVKIFVQLGTMFTRYDLALLEINPLIMNDQGHLICLDGKMAVDSNALYRQPQLREMYDPSQNDEREAHAEQWGLNYVALDGNIGCMINGAGLAMGTMDIVNLHGGKPANFLDVGGSTTKEKVMEAFKIILSDTKVEAVLVNIFGGIVRCDLIADGIIGAISEVGVKVPVVVRLEGNNADLGLEKLAQSGLNIITASSLTEAAEKVIAAAEGK